MSSIELHVKRLRCVRWDCHFWSISLWFMFARFFISHTHSHLRIWTNIQTDRSLLFLSHKPSFLAFSLRLLAINLLNETIYKCSGSTPAVTCKRISESILLLHKIGVFGQIMYSNEGWTLRSEFDFVLTFISSTCTTRYTKTCVLILNDYKKMDNEFVFCLSIRIFCGWYVVKNAIFQKAKTLG